MSRRILLLLMVIEFLGPSETAKRRFNFLIHNVTCLKFGDLVRKLECNLQKLETNRYSLNMSGFLQRQLSKDAEFLGMIHIKPAKRMTPIKFAEVRLKICETLTMPALPIPIAKTIFNEIMTKSNAPFSCPIKGNITYKMTDFKLTSDMFPSYTIIVDFNFTLNFYDHQKKFFNIAVQGATVPIKA